MPLRLDLRFMLWRSITSLPAVLIVSLIFIRTRRLLPLMVAHWAADAASVLILVVLPLLRR
jgi:membrane protease YdiL (CAAX protease family)